MHWTVLGVKQALAEGREEVMRLQVQQRTLVCVTSEQCHTPTKVACLVLAMQKSTCAIGFDLLLLLLPVDKVKLMHLSVPLLDLRLIMFFAQTNLY
jgi:hypothetical protein